MGDLDRREEDTGHGGARDAIGDIAHQIGIRISVEEDARGEVRPAATLPFQSVALRAVRTKDLRSGGDMVLAAGGDRCSEQHQRNPHSLEPPFDGSNCKIFEPRLRAHQIGDSVISKI